MFDVQADTSPLASIAQPDSEPAHIADPLADLLLSVAAIIVLAVIAIHPTIPGHSRLRDVQAGSIRSLPSSFRLQGVVVHPFAAIGQGLVVGAPSARVIPVDRILSDEGLVATLGRMRDGGETFVLLIDPSGYDTAFQFEVMANRYGPAKMRQVRLDSECGVERYCRDLVRGLEVRHP